MKEQIDTLVKAWYVVTMNETRDIVRDGAVAIKDGLIVEVGKFSELETKFLCDSMAPFDFPVVPDVYNIAAKSFSFLSIG